MSSAWGSAWGASWGASWGAFTKPYTSLSALDRSFVFSTIEAVFSTRIAEQVVVLAEQCGISALSALEAVVITESKSSDLSLSENHANYVVNDQPTTRVVTGTSAERIHTNKLN